jgi:Flp pilus assembly protein TadG
VAGATEFQKLGTIIREILEDGSVPMPILRFATRFASDRRASVVPMFAFSLVPILALIGAAVDYSRASATRTALQAALDATALAMSKKAAGYTSETDMTADAQQYFNAVFLRNDVLEKPTIAAHYDPAGGSKVVVSGSAKIKTYFLGVHNAFYGGFPELTVGASSTSKWGNTRLRVALVLDNTGSMSSAGKITALQTATKNLLDQLKTAAVKPEDVYVSIIPFSKDVAVDPATNYTASWIDWTDWDANWISDNTGCSKSKYTTKKKCQDNGGTWKVPTQAQATAAHNTWNGCIADRGNSGAPSTNDYDRSITAPVSSNTATLYPAEQYSNCPLQMMGMSNDWAAMKTLVGNMFPNGSTNQPIGLVWGWLSIAGISPLSAPPIDPNYQYSRVIILLSDGLNTQDRWYGNGSSTSTQVDARMLDPNTGVGTCKNIKDQGITIYTVQVNTGGDPTSTLLKKCASDSNHFFLLTSADEIVTTFQQIGTNLTKLRLAF